MGLGHYILGPSHEVIEIEVYKDGALNVAMLLKWATAAYGPDGEPANRRVAETTVGPFWISTVFLGLDHNFLESGPPLVFETMVFDNEHKRGFEEGSQWRYSTWDEACAGHARAVKLCRDHLKHASEEVEKIAEPAPEKNSEK